MGLYLTPKFTAGFCAISKPYENEFILKGRFEGEAKDQMLAALSKAVKDDPRDADITPSGVKWEEEDGEKTGALLVTFKCKAGGVRKKDGSAWSRTLNIVDSKNKPVNEEVSKGSTLRLKFTTYGTEFGGKSFLRLQPHSIQVIDLVQYTGGDASDAFDEVDGGFESAGEKPEKPAKTVAPVATDDDWNF
jgi:hypothetical protein